ncbi:MAG: pyrroloquinoline quinone precursor peptide PqqA [Candidatus Baltobacteraceae bacterium]
MNDSRQHWERPNFEERPLGAEVTAYLSAPIPDPKL